jgi:hypothetical protein
MHSCVRSGEILTLPNKALRDNLRHASIATTRYLQSDKIKRARQLNQAFDAR